MKDYYSANKIEFIRSQTEETYRDFNDSDRLEEISELLGPQLNKMDSALDEEINPQKHLFQAACSKQ